MSEAIEGNTTASSGNSLAGVVDRVRSNVADEGSGRVSIGDLVASLNDRGFGVLCAIIGALAAVPIIGGIPGVSVGTALLALLIAGQYVVGRRTPWIPSFLSERSLKSSSVEKGLDTVRPYARWLDKLVEQRLTWLVGGDTERRLIAAAICVLALTMFPLALVPWGVFPPALAIATFGIAITARDGVFAIIGYVLAAVTAYVLYAFSSVIVSFF